MRAIACALLFGLILIFISACAAVPDDPPPPGQRNLIAGCPWLQGYPDCRVES
jgi:hypothetical protein